MIKITELIAEAKSRPKCVIMAGSPGAGKSYVLDKLDLKSLPLVNPDKYVEDPDHPAHNNLSRGAALASKEVEDLSKNKQSFVWDTTASNPTKVKEIQQKGFDVFMVMVYSHPMVSFIRNFQRDRKVPKAALFQTWRNSYQLLGQYKSILGDNFTLIDNTQPEYERYVEAFNTAAKNGRKGIQDYLAKFMRNNGGEDNFKSTFAKPFELDPEAQEEFEKSMQGISYDQDDKSLDKQIKKYWFGFYDKNGIGPGADKLRKKLTTIYNQREKLKKNEEEVLDNIANMLSEPKFLNLLIHSSFKEVDQRLQNFLA